MGRIEFDDLQWATRRYQATAAYGQSKLADLLMSRHLAVITKERGWPLLSTAAHPGYTRTNLQTSGRSLGRDRPRTSAGMFRLVPSQDATTGTEPLLYAAADPRAVQGEYYGPRWLLVGPTSIARPPRGARDPQLAASLWSIAEKLTGTSLPNG